MVIGLPWWWLIQHVFITFLAASAERVLRLVDHPPLVTSLDPQGGAIFIHSYITGLGQAMASLGGALFHFYIVVTLALVVAVPFRTWAGRIRLAGLAVGVIALVTTALAAVKIKLAVEAEAIANLGITLHTVREKNFLESFDKFLIFGMLVFPAFLFLVSYLSFWIESRNEDSGKQGNSRKKKGASRRPHRERSRWLTWGTTAALGLAGFTATWAFLAVTREEADPWEYRASWEKVLELNPSYAPAHYNVGLFEEKAGRLDLAIEHYELAMKNDPNMFQVYLTLGNAYYKQGQFQLAAQRYKKSILIEPEFAHGHKNLGISLMHLGFDCDALRHLEESMRLDLGLYNDPLLQSETERLRSICR